MNKFTLKQIVRTMDDSQLYVISAIDSDLYKLKLTRLSQSKLHKIWVDLVQELSELLLLPNCNSEVKQLASQIDSSFEGFNWIYQQHESIWIPFDYFDINFKLTDFK